MHGPDRIGQGLAIHLGAVGAGRQRAGDALAAQCAHGRNGERGGHRGQIRKQLADLHAALDVDEQGRARLAGDRRQDSGGQVRSVGGRRAQAVGGERGGDGCAHRLQDVAIEAVRADRGSRRIAGRVDRARDAHE